MTGIVMELFLLGALMTVAAGFAAYELFDGGDDEEEPMPEEPSLTVVDGTDGDDPYADASLADDLEYHGGGVNTDIDPLTDPRATFIRPVA